MRAYLFVMVMAAVVTYIFTPIVLQIAKKINAITPLRDRDVHVDPVPRLGGLAMFVGLFVTFLVASRMSFFAGIFLGNSVWAVLGAGFLLTVLGFLDDLWDLDWFVKFAGQMLAAGLISWQGVQLLSLPIGGLTIGSSQMSLFLTLFVVALIINAINFVDGLDGLASGMVAIGGLAFFVYSYFLTREASPSDYSSLSALISACMVGLCLGFLPFNFFRAKIFMGDSGSMLLGLLLAASAIAVTGQIDPASVSEKQLLPVLLPIVIPFAVFIIPLYDLVTSVFRRLSAGKSPFTPDRGHVHHKLLDAGLSHTGAVLVLYVWAGAISFGTVAFVFTEISLVFVVCFVVLLFALASVITFLFNRKNKHKYDLVDFGEGGG